MARPSFLPPSRRASASSLVRPRGPSTTTALVLLAALLVPLLTSVSAVDHSKFRTCEQGSFCRRFKKWVALAEAPNTKIGYRVAEKKSDFVFNLASFNEDRSRLQLTLKFSKSGPVRFHITELNPLHPRYEIPFGDVVVSEDLADSVGPFGDVVVSEDLADSVLG